MDKDILNILNLLPVKVKEYFVYNSNRNITEIRIRQNCNITVVVNGQCHIINDTYISQSQLESLFFAFCDNTISAYEEQIAEGFITLNSGHRIGIAGKYAKDLNGKTILSQIMSVNVRLSVFHKINIPAEIMQFRKGLLVCGRPHSGKTTFLRNICLNLNGSNYTVCDERNEIIHTELKGDFLTGLPKADAIMQAVRVLNPDVIVCDEIGNSIETAKMLEFLNSGVRFVCSVHCNSISELYTKKNIDVLISSGVFDKIVMLYNHNGVFGIREIENV